MSVDFQAEDEYINVSGDLPGFIAELTSFKSKHTSFEYRIAVNESEKVAFKPLKKALTPVRTTYFRK